MFPLIILCAEYKKNKQSTTVSVSLFYFSFKIIIVWINQFDYPFAYSFIDAFMGNSYICDLIVSLGASLMKQIYNLFLSGIFSHTNSTLSIYL